MQQSTRGTSGSKRGLKGLPGPRSIPGVREPASAADLTHGSECPPWCRTTPEQHAHESAGSRLHEGPEFDLIRTWCLDNGTTTFIATLPAADGDQPGLDAAALRKLAEGALAAARWIEQESESARHGSGPSIADLVTRAHEAASRPARGA